MTSQPVREFLESLDAGQILPDDYAEYRPLLLDGLCFFLERLPQRRLQGIIREQFCLNAGTGFADRVLNLLHQCPTLHKLGQIVARDRRLCPELRLSLQQLESVPSTAEFDRIPQPLKNQLGDIGGVEVAPRPLAEASVAVILPFTWRDSGRGGTCEGVFKLLKSGVEDQLREELEIWGELGGFLERRCEHHKLPALDYRETLESMRRLLRQEVCFEREQRHLTEAAAFYDDLPEVVIPRLLPFCSREVTAMERIDGRKVTDAGLSANGRRKLARTLIEAMIAKPFWDPAEETLFHADPHAGNLLRCRDGKLAILDWTLVGRLTKAQRIALMQIVLGGMLQNEAAICRAVENLGRSRPGESALRACVSIALREVRQGRFPGFDWSQRLLDRIALSNLMGFPENLILFRKALLTLTSVVADIAEDASVDRVMFTTGLSRFWGEGPARLLAAPGSRAFGTHLSNGDLLALWGSSPNTAAAYWLGFWRDSLDSFGAGSNLSD